MAKINPIFQELFPKRLSKGDARKAAIIQEAVRQVATTGLMEVTFDSIGRALKIRRSHVAYYFKDAEELLRAGLEYAMATGQKVVTDGIDEEADPKTQIADYCRATFRWADRFPHEAIFCMHGYTLGASSAKWRKLNAKFKDSGRARLREMIKSACKGKSGPKELDRLSFEAHNVVVIAIMNHFGYKKRTSKELVSSAFKEIYRIVGIG